MTRNLVIVESPTKAKTITRFLGKDFTVKSCMGHIVDLSKKDLGVDIENGFEPQYIVPPEKKKIVSELKSSSKEAELVWLASDEDREGEAIAWHLKETLDLEEEKTKRIAFHEITRSAIEEAIKNPRPINRNLVYAQQARRVLDRLVGFELSPLLWKKIKPALSAGRVQSVAVRLIVEKEQEIRNFKSSASYRIAGEFLLGEGKKQKLVEAELDKRFETQEEARAFLRKCIGATFTVVEVETKPGKKSPAPPFTTSTLQQEASRKLGLSVTNTMRLAQELYESGLITYMRTDSVNLSEMALSMARKEITTSFGDRYVKTRKYTTRSKGAQEAHEAIRPTYLENKTIDGDKSHKRLYELIWKRTIASQMADAELEKTTATISISKSQEHFIARGETIKFDGFLKVYMESTDEGDQTLEEGVLPPLKPGDVLQIKQILAQQKFTQQPFRYTEATLVRKLEELGIGRPSTYAPTISTIQKRGYILREDKPGIKREYMLMVLKDKQITEEIKTEQTGFEKAKLFPADIGILVNSFLLNHFENILDYNFTASVEEEFDEIAEGKMVWNEMIRTFYQPFHQQIQGTLENTRKVSGERLLGNDPNSGYPIFVKFGRYGPMVQMGETDSDRKPRFAALRKGQSIETISLEEALDLFKLPRTIGDFESAEMIVSTGRFGPYIRHKDQYYSLHKTDDPLTITTERAIEIIGEKRLQNSQKIIREFPDDKELRILNGRYGAYISYKDQNYRIPKGKDPQKLSYEDCKTVVTKSNPSKSKSKRKSR
jgi:DNA topoisomerase-1